MFDGGVRGHTYRVGLAAGLAVALYRGNTKGTGWDFGVVYEPDSKLALGAVVGNVLQPVVRGARQVATVVPALTLKPFGPLLAFSAEGRIAVDSVFGYAVGARFQTSGRTPLGLLVRLDADHAFHRAALVFGVSVGGRGLFGTAASIPGGGSRVDTANLYGVIARTAER
jgi:hypothetical protein